MDVESASSRDLGNGSDDGSFYMKTIIAGSRTINSPEIVAEAIIESGFDITEVVSGTARGVDSVGEQIARDFGIPVSRFPADWYVFGKIAGVMRNKEMAKYADAAIVVWDGSSKGSANMIAEAKKAGLKVFVYEVGDS